MDTNIKRTALNITTYCNLKCKHCLAFIPYYKDKKSMSYDTAKKILHKYFEVVDSVEHFTITGGEPLLNKDVYLILQEAFEYIDRIKISIDFVTNGTLLINEDILKLFAQYKDKTKIILSNYGDSLSTKIRDNEENLKKYNISYRISKFYGDDLYYDGWIDFTNHDLKWKSIDDRDKNAQKCVHGQGKYFVINDGEIHRCSRQFWRIHENIIPKVEGEYVPLLDDSISVERKRELLNNMISQKSGTSCAYCVGLCNGAERVMPAQQLV